MYEKRIQEIRDQYQIELQQVRVQSQETILQLQRRLSETTASLQSIQETQLEMTDLKLQVKRLAQAYEKEKNSAQVLRRAFDDLKAHNLELEKVALTQHASLTNYKKIEMDLLEQL